MSKLAQQAYWHMDSLPPGEIQHDEIRQVIIDTELLLLSDDIDATLDRWKEEA